MLRSTKVAATNGILVLVDRLYNAAFQLLLCSCVSLLCWPLLLEQFVYQRHATLHLIWITNSIVLSCRLLHVQIVLPKL